MVNGHFTPPPNKKILQPYTHLNEVCLPCYSIYNLRHVSSTVKRRVMENLTAHSHPPKDKIVLQSGKTERIMSTLFYHSQFRTLRSLIV